MRAECGVCFHLFAGTARVDVEIAGSKSAYEEVFLVEIHFPTLM